MRVRLPHQLQKKKRPGGQNRKKKMANRFALLFLTAMNTALITACGGDESIIAPEPLPEETEGLAIGFCSQLNEDDEQTTGTRATRAGGLEDTHTSFKVYGYKTLSDNSIQTVFNGYTVNYTSGTANTTESNTADWEYVTGSQTIKYWDYSASAYRFMAVAPADKGSFTNTSGQVTLTLSDLDATASGQPLFSDLTLVSTTNYGQTVTLKFKQPFAKVRYYFINSEGATVTAAESSFKPTDTSKNIYGQGSLTITYPLVGSTYTATSSGTGTTTLGQANTTYTPVIPTANGCTFTVTFKKETSSEEKTAVVPASYMNWQPNYAYTYIFKVSDTGSVIFYDAMIEAWTSGGTQTEEWHNW